MKPELNSANSRRPAERASFQRFHPNQSLPVTRNPLFSASGSATGSFKSFYLKGNFPAVTAVFLTSFLTCFSPGAEPAAQLVVTPHHAPVLSGKTNHLFDVVLRLDSPKIIQSLAVQQTGLESVRIDPPLGSGRSLAAGEHRLRVTGTLAAGADLRGEIKASVGALTFSDGSSLSHPDVNVAVPFRPAVVIHQRGEANCHTFRIPGLARTKKGSLLAVYDMRYESSGDLQGHMDIGLSRSTDGGRGSEPGYEIERTAQFMMVRSTDDGQTWSKPENWTRQLKQEDWWLFAPAPGNGITLADGTLVLPTQGRDAKGFPFSNLMWSRDHGKSWTISQAARDDTTECAVAVLSDGALLLNMRDNRNRADKSATNGRAVSITRDLGKT